MKELLDAIKKIRRELMNTGDVAACKKALVSLGRSPGSGS